MTKIEFKFGVGDRVVIDNGDICGVVITLKYLGGGINMYSVSWMANSQVYQADFDEFRLFPDPADEGKLP